MSTQKQERLLKARPEIVVGTPGRLWELMSGGEIHLVEVSNEHFRLYFGSSYIFEFNSSHLLLYICVLCVLHSCLKFILSLLNNHHGDSYFCQSLLFVSHISASAI